MKVSGQVSHLGHFIQEERSLSIHLTRGWVDPRTGQNTLEKRKNPLHLSCVKPRFFAKHLNCDHSRHQNSVVRKNWKRHHILYCNSETPWTSRVFCRSTVWQTLVIVWSKSAFLKRRAAARYRALASIIPGRDRLSWNLSF